MPFLTEHLWQILVREVDGNPPASVHLAGWPDAPQPDEKLLAEVAEVRRVVGLGHQVAGGLAAEAAAAAASARRRGSAARRGSRRRAARGAAREGGRVRPRRGDRAARQAAPARARPEARQGARRGAGRTRRGRVRAARGRWLPCARPRARSRTRFSSSARARRAGRSLRRTASPSRSTRRLDAELELEGRVYDLIHTLNAMRKEQGLELTDRIAVTLPQADADLVERHAEWIKARGARGLARDRRRRRAADRQGLAPSRRRIDR